MPWLFPSIVSGLCGAVVLEMVYIYLYVIYRERFLGILTLSWGVYALRFIASLAMIAWGSSSFLLLVSEGSTIISAYLLLVGTALLVRSKTHGINLWIAGSAFIWTILGVYYSFSFYLLTIPSYTFIAYLYIWTGGKILKSELPSGVGKTVTAAAMILWGIHKANYPFLRHVDWFAPWGYILAAVLSIVVALGLILVFFEKTRSELINANERFRTLVNTIPDLIWLKDTDGIYLSCNTKFEQLVGVKEAGIVGKTDYDFFEKDLADFFRDNDRKAMTARKPFINEEWITYAEDGRRVLLETIKTPMYDAYGKDIGVLGIGRDITERKQMESTIKIKNEELEKKNRDLVNSEINLNKSLREKETLIREIYHRTNNTMMVIGGMIALQTGSCPDNIEVQQLGKDIEDRIRSISLVHQMLYKSQDLSQIPIKEYVQTLTSEVMKSFNISNDRISLHIEVDEQKFLLDTAIPFGLIINELLTNSFKYAFPHNKEGLIKIRLINHGNEINTLYYSDNGIGVSDDFDFRKQTSMGFQLIYGIGEQQMMGKVTMENKNGIVCVFEFKNNFYIARV